MTARKHFKSQGASSHEISKSATIKHSKAERPVKRRCRQACRACHARKVRCDVDISLRIPCNNCRLDFVKCVIPSSNKNRKALQGARETICRYSQDASISSPETLEYSHGYGEISETYSPPREASNEKLQFSSRGRSSEPDAESASFRHEQTEEYELKQSRCNSFSASQPSQGRSSDIHLHLISNNNLLPDYIRELTPKISEVDLEFLRRKGALSIPPEDLRNELLRSYIQYVDPYMPLLELTDFIVPILKNDGSQRISLFLFQAVMFAACAMVDLKFLQAAGYENRKAARKAFFQRARLLYDLDTELDRISLVQGVLLITYWFETPEDQKDTWHWIGVGLSIANTLGLHRNQDNPAMSLAQLRLRKRIWWCYFMRDKLSALALRRPMRITDGDYDVSMLTLDDLNRIALPAEAMQTLKYPTAIADPAIRLKLSAMCVEKTQLCRCIGHILEANYLPTVARSHAFRKPWTSATTTFAVTDCDAELLDWYSHADGNLLVGLSHSRNMDAVVTIHLSLLIMLYSTATITLHLPRLLPNTSMSTQVFTFSRTRVEEAATKITEIAHELHKQDLVLFLPPSGLTMLFPAIIVHLLNIKSSGSSSGEKVIRRFNQCVQVIQRLRDIYTSADFAIFFLEVATRKANLSLPCWPRGEKMISRAVHTVDTCSPSERALTPASEMYDSGQGSHPIGKASNEDVRGGATTLWADSSDPVAIYNFQDDFVPREWQTDDVVGMSNFIGLMNQDF